VPCAGVPEGAVLAGGGEGYKWRAWREQLGLRTSWPLTWRLMWRLTWRMTWGLDVASYDLEVYAIAGREVEGARCQPGGMHRWDLRPSESRRPCPCSPPAVPDPADLPEIPRFPPPSHSHPGRLPRNQHASGVHGPQNSRAGSENPLFIPQRMALLALARPGKSPPSATPSSAPTPKKRSSTAKQPPSCGTPSVHPPQR